MAIARLVAVAWVRVDHDTSMSTASMSRRWVLLRQRRRHSKNCQLDGVRHGFVAGVRGVQMIA